MHPPFFIRRQRISYRVHLPIYVTPINGKAIGFLSSKCFVDAAEDSFKGLYHTISKKYVPVNKSVKDTNKQRTLSS
jgi:hypothetical protein